MPAKHNQFQRKPRRAVLPPAHRVVRPMHRKVPQGKSGRR